MLIGFHWLAALVLAVRPDFEARSMADEPPPPAAVVARVDGSPIYRSNYVDVLRRAGHAAVNTQQERHAIAARVLEELINEQLLSQLLQENHSEVLEAEIDALEATLRQQIKANGLSFEQFLAASGRDRETLRRQLAMDIAVGRMLSPMVTADRLTKAYETHGRDFDGTRLRVSHILLRPNPALGDEAFSKTLDRAAKIRADVIAGSHSFAEAVRRHSAAPSRCKDGDLGFIPRHGLLLEEFTREVFRLGPGEISQPFVTSFGVHLATVTEVDRGGLDLDAIKPDLARVVAADLLREMLAQRRRTANVTYGQGIPHFAEPVGQTNGSMPVIVIEPPVDARVEPSSTSSGEPHADTSAPESQGP